MSTVLKTVVKSLNDLTERNSEVTQYLTDLSAKNSDISHNHADLKDETSEVLKLLKTHADQIADVQTENKRLCRSTS